MFKAIAYLDELQKSVGTVTHPRVWSLKFFWDVVSRCRFVIRDKLQLYNFRRQINKHWQSLSRTYYFGYFYTFPSEHSKISLFLFLSCCVFWSGFGCCTHWKAGQHTFWLFSTISLILKVFFVWKQEKQHLEEGFVGTPKNWTKYAKLKNALRKSTSNWETTGIKL